MTDREKLIELLTEPISIVESPLGDEFSPKMKMGLIYAGNVADSLLANGVTFASAVPGPSEADPNIMELCFHNGERHMKEKVISILDAFDKDYPYIDYDALRKAMMDL